MITAFLGRLSSLSLYNFPEGNSLVAVELVRLLEISGSVTAKRSYEEIENTPLVGSNNRV